MCNGGGRCPHWLYGGKCGLCGFAGYIGSSATYAVEDVRSILNRMGSRIAHRGPDDSGIWIDEQHAVGMVHRRLSIVDMSPAGHQPMVSNSGRHILAFNGEIYNHRAIRDELSRVDRAPAWRGHSDNETLIAAIEAWGVADTLRRLTGMFAFAVWDRHANVLTLARDRIGEKPLYFGWQGIGRARTLLFGSELKALRAHPAFDAEIDRAALSSMLRHSTVPAPRSIYRSTHKLPPGCLVELRPGGGEAAPVRYWSVVDLAGAGARHPVSSTADEAVDELERLLRQSLSGQMMADVPLGAFLSGGVDSSTVVALMQSQSSRPIETFSLGFEEPGFDEARYARAVAAHLGTEHHELYVTANEALAVVPELPAIYDEPFADASQIPTLLLSRMARGHITVALSGDGGDELFCGYDRYRRADRVWRALSLAPASARRTAQRILEAAPDPVWSLLSAALSRRAAVMRPFTAEKMLRAAGLVGSESLDQFYSGLTSRWADPTKLVIDGEPSRAARADTDSKLNPIDHMMALDLAASLPDEILTKVDRASMAASLEVRTPLLDYRLVEYALRLPVSYKVRDGRTKWPLRRILDRYVPRELIDRPKRGFGVPLAAWLRGSLRDWAEALLDETRLRREGFLNAEPIRAAWTAHLSGRIDLHNKLWNVLMFQAWLEQQSDPHV